MRANELEYLPLRDRESSLVLFQFEVRHHDVALCWFSLDELHTLKVRLIFFTQSSWSST